MKHILMSLGRKIRILFRSYHPDERQTSSAHDNVGLHFGSLVSGRRAPDGRLF